jgi:hypothetical protein
MLYHRLWRTSPKSPFLQNALRYYLRHHVTTIPAASRGRYYPLRSLTDPNLKSFRKQCFQPEQPVSFRACFRHIPAYDKWFTRESVGSHALKHEYLVQYGDALVPLELTQHGPRRGETCGTDEDFHRLVAPLSLFLDWTRSMATQVSSLRLYLAQCQLSSLPSRLRGDLPTPALVLHAGNGDIYDANIWIGLPPTYTPLHRDPNPNLLVQMAGTKHVRLHAPDIGQRIFSRVQMALGRSADRQVAAFRCEEMMRGRERTLLEQTIWSSHHRLPDTGDPSEEEEGFEAVLEVGDGIFIPNGWWHSVKGTGEGITASVCFLFHPRCRMHICLLS